MTRHGVDGRDKPGHDDWGRRRRRPTANAIRATFLFLKIENSAIIVLAMTDPIDRTDDKTMGRTAGSADLVGTAAPTGEKEKNGPGGRRKSLKTLVSDKRIQGNPSLFL